MKKITKPAPLVENSPILPAPYEVADAAAIQALVAGTAEPQQQQRAMKWIIEVACMTYDFPYRPGSHEGERDTNVALGRMFAGQQIVKLTRLNISRMRSSENEN